MPEDDLHPAGDPFIGEKFRETDARLTESERRVIFVHSLATLDGYPMPGRYIAEIIDDVHARPTDVAHRIIPEGRLKKFRGTNLAKNWEKVSH